MLAPPVEEAHGEVLALLADGEGWSSSALALALGARVQVQIGYRLRVLEVDGAPSRSMRAAVRLMVEDRAIAKRIWGKGSLVEQMIKVATNSCYGKLAQDVAEVIGFVAPRPPHVNHDQIVLKPRDQADTRRNIKNNK